MRLSLASSVVAFLLCSSVAAADLDSKQQRFLKDAQYYLTQVEKEVPKLVALAQRAQTARPRELQKGLQQIGFTGQKINNVLTRLQKLPAQHAEVEKINVAVRQQATLLVQVETVLKAVLGGGNQAPTAGAQALDSAQQRTLKDAEYYMKQAAKEVAAVTRKVDEIRGAKDITTVEFHKLQDELNKVHYAGLRLDNVESRVTQLPTAHPQVKDLATRVANHRKTLAAAKELFSGTESALKKVRDPSNWQGFDADQRHMNELSVMIAFPTIFQSDPARAAVVSAELPKMIEYFAGIKTKYKSIIQQQTDIGQQVKGEVYQFERRLGEFREAAQAFVKTAGASIDQHLTYATELAERAVKEKNPRSFANGNGVPNNLTQAKAQLNALKVLTLKAPAPYKAAKSRFDQASAKLKRAELSLKDEILKTNRAPEDRYAGEDRAHMDELVQKKWQEKYPNDRILGIRWGMKEWDRSTGYRWQGVALEWYKYDYSELHASVIVQTSPDVASIYHCYCVKDHMKSDRIKVTEDDKTYMSVNRQLLVSNFQ